MADIEKVIKALECCLKESDHLYSNPCNGCPYEGQECIDRMKADAIVLLKEQEDALEQMRLDNTDLRNCNAELMKAQEAVKPKNKVRHGENAQYQHFCGNCMVMLHGKPKYCSNCGMKVKWV